MIGAGGAQIAAPRPTGDARAAAFTLGVEEEFQLIDPATRNPRASAAGRRPRRGAGAADHPKARYQHIARAYRQFAVGPVSFGCHARAGIADPELAIATKNCARAWLAPLVALAASCPFWNGADTGCASHRTELSGRWPAPRSPPRRPT